MIKRRKQPNRWSEILGWLKLAEDDLKLAQLAYEDGFSRGAVSRTYYAMFYAAKAFLLVNLAQVDFKTHAGLIAQFHKLAKAKKLPAQLPKQLTAAFEARGEADYDLNETIGQREAGEHLAAASHFVETIQHYLHSRR